MLRAAAIGAVIVFAAASVHAAPVNVPNHSFELPLGDPGLFGANFTIDEWDEDAYGLADEGQITGVDGGGNPTGVGLDTGVFTNPPTGNPGHLDNADASQGGFLFARNSRWVRQTLADVWQGGQYKLTIGVASSTFQPVAHDSRLEIALYYDDDGTDATETIHIIASAFVRGDDVATYTGGGGFIQSTAFVDIMLAGVTPPPAALGYAIGILIRPEQIDPTADESRTGVWDIDNVRLDLEAIAVPTPSAAASAVALLALAAARRRR